MTFEEIVGKPAEVADIFDEIVGKPDRVKEMWWVEGGRPVVLLSDATGMTNE